MQEEWLVLWWGFTTHWAHVSFQASSLSITAQHLVTVNLVPRLVSLLLTSQPVPCLSYCALAVAS